MVKVMERAGLPGPGLPGQRPAFRQGHRRRPVGSCPGSQVHADPVHQRAELRQSRRRGRRHRCDFAPGGAVIVDSPQAEFPRCSGEEGVMRNILIVAGGVVAVAAIAARGVISGPARPPRDWRRWRSPRRRTSRRCSASSPATMCMGDPKAPITLIEYASFTCPHCAHFAVAVLPEIKKKWVDTGKVKLIYRDFPLDQTAVKAAQLAECAGKDKYFGVIDMIFAHPGEVGRRVRSDRRARQVAAHRRHGRRRGQGVPGQRCGAERRDRRLSRRRGPGRQLDADAFHQWRAVQGRAFGRGTRRGRSASSRSSQQTGVV